MLQLNDNNDNNNNTTTTTTTTTDQLELDEKAKLVLLGVLIVAKSKMELDEPEKKVLGRLISRLTEMVFPKLNIVVEP